MLSDKNSYTLSEEHQDTSINITIEVTSAWEIEAMSFRFERHSGDSDEPSRVFQPMYDIVSKPMEGTSQTWEISIPIINQLPSGTYMISEMFVWDYNQDFWYFTSEDIRLEFEIVNEIDTDDRPPELISVSADKFEIDAAKGESVTFTIEASDESGVADMLLSLEIENDGRFIQLEDMNPLLIHEDDNIYQSKVTFTPNRWTRPGVYRVSVVYLMDSSSLHNSDYYLYPWSDESEGLKLMPEGSRIDITVRNDDYIETFEPRVTSLELSSESVVAGDFVEITAYIDDGGTPLKDDFYLRILDGRGEYAGNQLAGINMKRENSEEPYTGTFFVPPNWQNLPIVFGYMIHHANEDLSTQYFAEEDETYQAPTLQIQSVFSGTEHGSLMIGDAFDPLAGVTAANETEGDLTEKIEVKGEVDTSKVGLYLLRYEIPSDLKDELIDDHEHINRIGNYVTSRWIGVNDKDLTELETYYEGDMPLVIAEVGVEIDASNETILLTTAEGDMIEHQGSIDQEGHYSVTDTHDPVYDQEDESDGEETDDNGEPYLRSAAGTVADTAVVWGSRFFAAPVVLSSAGDEDTNENSENKRSVSFVIDRSGPQIDYFEDWYDERYVTIELLIEDLSPIAVVGFVNAELEAAKDLFAADQFENITAEHRFKALPHDTYTIMAVDALGNTSFMEIFVQGFGDTGGSDEPSDPTLLYDYDILGQTVTITGFAGGDEGAVLPAKIKNLPVTRIAPHAMANMSLFYVVFAEGLLEIDRGAFANNYLQGALMLPEGLEKIGALAFAGNSLEEAYIPASVNRIGNGAFQGSDSVIIKGYADTAAEAYARENKLKFVSLGAAPAQEAGMIPHSAYHMVTLVQNPITQHYEGKIETGGLQIAFSSKMELDLDFMVMETKTSDLPLKNGQAAAGIFFQIQLLGGSLEHASIELTIQYDRDDLPAGVQEQLLAIYRYNPESGDWERLPDQVLDMQKQTIQVTLNGFSDFAILAEEVSQADSESDDSDSTSPAVTDAAADLESATTDTADDSNVKEENPKTGREGRPFLPALFGTGVLIAALYQVKSGRKRRDFSKI